MTKKEKDLAVCQLNTIAAIYIGGDKLDISQAIIALDLNNEECLKLAEENGMEMIAKEIEESLNG